jgi:alpha-L-fucosidase
MSRVPIGLCLSLVLLSAFSGRLSAGSQSPQVEPNWESIDAHPIPAWFDEAKFGIFIHWGVYSVPAWGPLGRYSEWYWHDLVQGDGKTREFHEKTYGADFQYQDFAGQFKAELFDPAEWARIFKDAGAKYVVLTSKHHDGYCLWPSSQAWNWNSVDTGPHRDLAGDLTTAVREAGLKMGFYYSLYEWYNPLYKADVNAYVERHMIPQFKDLVTRYQPSLLFTDGEWDHPSEVWKSTEIISWLFNEGPNPQDVVINDRWGKETRNTHGGYYTTEYGHVGLGKEADQSHKWEECRGIGKSFGYNRNENLSEYTAPKDLVHLLVDLVSKGGNLLLDVGPTGDGRIPVIMEQRLAAMGDWLEINGEAIYGTTSFRTPGEGEVRYTRKGDTVYAIDLGAAKESLALPGLKPKGELKVEKLGTEGALQAAWEEELQIVETPCTPSPAEPDLWARAYRIQGVE